MAGRGNEATQHIFLFDRLFPVLSCSSERCSTTTPARIPPSPARTRPWPSGGGTSSRLSARRTRPGGRPVTRGTARVARDSSPQRSFSRGGRPGTSDHLGATQNLYFTFGNRRVVLQRPKAIFKPGTVKAPGDESKRQMFTAFLSGTGHRRRV